MGLFALGIACWLARDDDGSRAQLLAMKKILHNLEPRDSLKIMKSKGAWNICTSLKPFESFPTKKARFKVFPQSEEKLEYLKQYKEPGKQTMKDALDTVLKSLLSQLPEDYWDHKAEVGALLSPHLPTPGGEQPISLSMNSLGYALLQELAELLGTSQGAVLEAAAAMWLIHHHDLRAKRQDALAILTEFSSQAYEAEGRLKTILDDPDDPILNGFGIMMVHLDNLHTAVDDYVTQGKPSWRENMIEGAYE